MSESFLVIDCDTGVDDALALTVALRWPNAHVEAISCVAGNTGLNNVLRNTITVVKSNRKFVKIYAGCHYSLLRRKHTLKNSGAESTHAANGLGGVEVELSNKDWEMVQHEHAVIALVRLAAEHKGKITLVALAPLTNVAMAMRLDPDFSVNLKEIVIMGGNYIGPGSEVGGAEFNFYIDAEAADIVLREARCPITVVPFDTCEVSSPLPWSYFNEITSRPNLPQHGQLIRDIMSHFNASWPLFDPCDAVAMVAAIDPSSIVSSDTHRHLAVNIDGDPLAGHGYGCLLHDNNGADLMDCKLLLDSAPIRKVIKAINTSDLKRHFESALF